jgi:hypothetical protein
MPDTIRNEAALQALFADNTSGDISPQDLRDFLVSVPTLASTANLPLAGGTMTGTITSTLGTLAGSSTPAISSTATWNNGATTFTHILVNITQTAASGSSLYLDFQSSGSSQFRVDRYGLMACGRAQVGLSTVWFDVTNNGAQVASNVRFSFSSTTSATGSPDTAFYRNAAGVVEINNGTAGTYRDLILRNLDISGGSFQTGGGSNGMGIYSNRWIRFATGSTGGISWSSSTTNNGAQDLIIYRSAASVLALTNAGSAGAAIEFLEQTAPSAGAANTVRIYAEDNGSGKTRLMALFQSGAAQQIAIEP